jgi:hypothetical protein
MLNAKIKYIRWLSKAYNQKPAIFVIIEFIISKDANRIINKNLIWQKQIFNCEQYNKTNQLKQCYNC